MPQDEWPSFNYLKTWVCPGELHLQEIYWIRDLVRGALTLLSDKQNRFLLLPDIIKVFPTLKILFSFTLPLQNMEKEFRYWNDNRSQSNILIIMSKSILLVNLADKSVNWLLVDKLAKEKIKLQWRHLKWWDQRY